MGFSFRKKKKSEKPASDAANKRSSVRNKRRSSAHKTPHPSKSSQSDPSTARTELSSPPDVEVYMNESPLVNRGDAEDCNTSIEVTVLEKYDDEATAEIRRQLFSSNSPAPRPVAPRPVVAPSTRPTPVAATASLPPPSSAQAPVSTTAGRFKTTVVTPMLEEEEEEEPFDLLPKRRQTERQTEQDDEPFDLKADYHGPEDPTILDIQHSKEEPKPNAETSDKTDPNKLEPGVFAKQLISSFNCAAQPQDKASLNEQLKAMGATALDEMICGPKQLRDPEETRRPVYNDQFAAKFLDEMLHEGISVLYHQPPGTNGKEEWTGQSVTLIVNPGSTSTSLIPPKLEWATRQGTQSISLLDIHSVAQSTALEDMRDDEFLEDLCFFTITTEFGDVHVFESSTVRERDRMVSGLENVVCRFAHALVAGDVAKATELFKPDGASPQTTMNRMSNLFLE